jgi:hypothetical protein
MEALAILLLVPMVVAFVALIPKGSRFSERQLKEGKKEIERLVG